MKPAAERLFGHPVAEAIGKPAADLTGLDQIDERRGLMERAIGGNVSGPIGGVRVRRSGADVEIELTLMPIRGTDRAVTGLALSARDITERKEADAHRTLLLRELSHRVKNALATVQAVATQTLKSAATPDAFVASFSARLMAMAKTHDLLSDGGWQEASLQEVLEAELAPYQSVSHARWTCDGPAIRLDANTALALGMAFHELATNAAKHGALSVPEGRVNVTWESKPGGTNFRLRLLWVETGGPPVQMSGRKGFGIRLVREGLAYELDGEVSLEFDAAGVRCAIDIPLRGPETVHDRQ